MLFSDDSIWQNPFSDEGDEPIFDDGGDSIHLRELSEEEDRIEPDYYGDIDYNEAHFEQ